MSKPKKKNLLKNINLSKFKLKISLSKFDFTLILTFLLIQTAIAGATLYKGIYHFPAAFLKNNYVPVIVILLISLGTFYFTYREYVKKVFSLWTVLVYLFIEFVLFFNIIAINSDLEFLTKRDIFTTGNYIFIFFLMILSGLMISKYDFPIISNWKEYYAVSFTNFYKNLGIFLAFAVIVAIIGFLNVTFIYAISFILILKSIYLAKAILANLRK